MCGLCGIVSVDPRRGMDRRQLLAMRDSLAHRGPDDAGEFLAGGIALGSRRLSILDLSPRGHMPMRLPPGEGSLGGLTLVYNGEVYNYRELRQRLVAQGVSFFSQTDTEVLLRLFARQGPGMLPRLNGMFAFAVWDEAQRSLLLARDRLGIKPLYYALRGGDLYFASEIKALFAAGLEPRLDPAAWPELLSFRFVAGEETLFSGVRRLLPGHWLRWQDGRVEIRRWWSLAERVEALRETPPAEAAAWYRESLDDSVRLRRISDVPVGVLLSGGLDSSSVAASMAAQEPEQVASFTVRFAESAFDEGPLARQVAKRWRLEAHEVFAGDLDEVALLEDASWLHDEPLVQANDHYLLAISRVAKEWVTVLLSGEGADETLGGYVRYQPLRFRRLLGLARTGRAALGAAGGRAGKLARFLKLGPLDRLVLYNACDVLPEDLRALGLDDAPEPLYRRQVLEEARGLYPEDLARQAMYSDLWTFLQSILQRTDRMSMGASIECRVPFLDHRLVEGLAALPSSVLLEGRRSKGLLRAAVGDRLPAEVRRHKKWGFGVPWNRLLREVPAFRAQVEDLPRLEPLAGGPLDSTVLAGTARAFLQGDDSQGVLMKQLVLLTTWHRAFFGRLRELGGVR